MQTNPSPIHPIHRSTVTGWRRRPQASLASRWPYSGRGGQAEGGGGAHQDHQRVAAPRHVRCPAQEGATAVWKRCNYFCSTLKAHEDDVYCMKCRKWIHDGSFSHVNQHENRNHAGWTPRLAVFCTDAWISERKAHIQTTSVFFLSLCLFLFFL